MVKLVLGNRIKGGRPARARMRMFRMGERMLSEYEYNTLDLTQIGGDPANSPKHIVVDEVKRFFDRAGKGMAGASITDPRMTTGAVVFALMENDGDYTNHYWTRTRIDRMIDDVPGGYRSWGNQLAEQESIGLRFALRQMDSDQPAFFDNSLFKTSNILWEFSPDGGRGKWYQLYELPNQKNMRINLPEPTNQIRLRAISNNPEEWVQAIAVSIKQDWQNRGVEHLFWHLTGESQDPADYVDFDDLGYLLWPEAHGGKGDIIYELYWSAEEDFQDVVFLGRSKQNDLSSEEFEMPVQYLGGWLHVIAFDAISHISISKRFTRSLLDTDVICTPSQYIYDGMAHMPEIAVVFRLDGSVLPPEFYDVEYSDNIDVGTAEVLCTGKDYYYGTPDKYGHFSIEPRSVSDCTIILEYDSIEFDGESHTPDITVKIGDFVVSTDDYTVSYSDYVHAGTATVTVSGENNLSGEIDLHYTITPTNLVSMSISPNTYVYASARTVPTETVIGIDSEVLTRDTDYELVVPQIADSVGTYVFSANGIGDYKGTVSSSLVITRASIANAVMADIPDQYFVNEQIKPKPTITRHEVMPDGTEGDKTLVEGVDFYYTWGDNISATGTVSATGMGNYQGQVAQKSFNISMPVIHTWGNAKSYIWKVTKAMTWEQVEEEEHD